jgi:phosphoribosylaminoimidazole-succinocarboxamide synthase
MIDSFLNKTIDDISLIGSGLSAPYSGKVRQSYDAPGGRKIIIATDRLSAFDKQITTIPLKGQVLTQLSRYWFEKTKDICPNHVLAYPDPNVVVCRKLKMLPVELVVRGYLAGSTATSILKMYKSGKREMYGVKFPDGMRDNQELPHPIITPTTKAAVSEHDAPLSPQQIVAENIVDKSVWDKVSAYALALFARGQKIAKERGLILADTKYEFGLLPDGTAVLGDEIHTPDSSRYWIEATYSKRLTAGESPETLDKDVARRWLLEHCDPYRDKIPPIPDSVRLATAETYVSVYEKITGEKFAFPDPSKDPKERIKDAVAKYLEKNP